MRRTAPRGQNAPWATLTVVAAGVLASTISGVAEALQYDRIAVADGAYWLPLTGQLVHWTPRMAAADLLIVLLAGVWIELRSRRLTVWTLALSLPTIGLVVHFWASHLSLYRGSSGVASSLFAVTCLELARARDRPAWMRGTAVGGLLLLVGKIAWEATGGAAVAAGTLPPGVDVAPSVHVAGVCVGIACFAVNRGSGVTPLDCEGVSEYKNYSAPTDMGHAGGE